jgi:HEAT repeat protein
LTVRNSILNKLTASRNLAVERAVEVALAGATPAEQAELADVLLQRNGRSGWVAMIRAFDRLAEPIRQKLVARPRDLFGPLSETMQDAEGPARENVIAIVRHCADARLVYLLAEALMDPRHQVRELAGRSLLDAVRRHCEPLALGTSDQCLDREAAAQVQRAIDFALRHYATHRQNTTLLTALIQERQHDSPLWTLFHDPYDDLTRAATVTLRAPSEPSVAPALLLALASPLKPAAMAGIASIENPAMAKAVAAQSYRFVDPLLRDAARGIAHLKLLPALRRNPPWDLASWASWLRLIESVGLQPAERLTWLTSLYGAAPASAEAVAWKMCTLRAIADTALPEAGLTLATAVRDDDQRVARFAARILVSRRAIPGEWRDIARDVIPRSPHLSVRRLFTGTREPRPSAAIAGGGGMLRAAAAMAQEPVGGTFEKIWSSYPKLPPVVQHNAARAVAADPAHAEGLRQKLQSGTPQEIAQGLRMLTPLPRLTAFRAQVIALCGHADPRIAAMAVRLVGRLEDPKLRDLLEAAMKHADARVRANAVESVEELRIADKSQQILAMLNSRHSRERANAIKAIGQFNFATARECLLRMLTDPNPLHRMAALWVVGQLNLLDIMRQVALVARRDPNLRVRSKAAEMVETLSGNLPTPL